MKSENEPKEVARLGPPVEPDPSDDPTHSAPGVDPTEPDDQSGLA